MGQVRRKRALFACLTLAIVWAQVLGGVLCMAAGARGGFGNPADILGAQVICSASGEHRAAPDGNAPASTAGRCCDLCLAAASLVPASPPVTAASPIAVALDAPRWEAAIASFADTLRRAGLNSRAPPLRA